MKKLLLMMFILLASVTFSLERGEYISTNLNKYVEQNKDVNLNDETKNSEVISGIFNFIAYDYLYNYTKAIESLDKNDENFANNQIDVAKDLLTAFLNDIFVVNASINFVQSDDDNAIIKLNVGVEKIDALENNLIVGLIRGVSHKYIFPNAKTITLEIYSDKELTNKLREAVI